MIRVAIIKNKKVNKLIFLSRFEFVHVWRRKRDSLLSSPPQNSTLDYFLPNGNTQSKDCSLLIRIPLSFFATKKGHQKVSFIVAEKEGFEPSLHLSHTTPLAGEPLEPLGYFSTKLKFNFRYFFYAIFKRLRYVNTKNVICQKFF